MKLIRLFTIFFLTGTSFGQTYFQQNVNTKIDVKLDDKNHILRGFEQIDYTNNSSDTLTFIYIHLWPNAYQSTFSALGRQILEDGNTNLHFSYDKDKGYIDSLNFKTNSISLKWEYDSVHHDIAKIILAEPLFPSSNVKITTPFKVKFPNSNISRMGHVGESYQVTQWYPKPAVYDNTGWHPMPYLSQGEFYSEYGSFDVKITLPKNYIVGATGDLVNGESELAWLSNLDQKARARFNNEFKRDMSFPESSKEFKTLHYHQENVHDFGWFADKRFNVLKDTVTLPNSKRIVDTWLMFTDNEARLWKDAMPYIKDAIYYYSLWTGDYPYNQVTAVDGTISAGGGMEYPNVTIIGESGTPHLLEQVIVHEVGHNWFYGILGSNERKNAWMDEGLNSFTENRYFYTKYPKGKLINLPEGIEKKFNLAEYPQRYMSDLSYAIPASYNKDQPIQFSSERYSSLNYGGIVYAKTAIMFDYLKEFLGEETFDNGMMKYYKDWKFKHPAPYDVQHAFESVSGQDLSWFFNDMLKTTDKIDYKITKRIIDKQNNTTKVIVKSVGSLNAPISVTSFSKNDTLSTLWSKPLRSIDTLTFSGLDYHHFQINSNKKIPELNGFNNYYKNKGLLKSNEPIRFQFIGGLDNPGKTNVYFAPIAGWNNYDKTMLGMAFYNHLAFKKPFEYTIAPMYSFATKSLTGLSKLEYTFFPIEKITSLALGVNSARFNTYNSNELKSNFIKITPYITAELKPENVRKRSKKIVSSAFNMIQNSYAFDDLKSIENIVVSSTKINLISSQVLKPKSLILNYNYGVVNNINVSSYSNLTATGKYRHNYDKDLHSISLRAFAGVYLHNTTRDSRFKFYDGGSKGYSDVTYNNVFLGRNEPYENMLSQQMVLNEGALRTLTPSSSNKWLTSVSIDLDIPLMLPFNLYFDASATPYTFYNVNASLTSNEINYNAVGGLSFKIIKNMFEVYVPIFVSNDLKEFYKYKNINFFQRIRFTFDINNLNPFKLIEENIN